jgi:hypothetical protein
MINYAIPGLYSHHQINLKLLDLMERKPEYFHPNVKIEAAYGTFPCCIFDGGRIFDSNQHASIEEIKHIVSEYNKYGVAARLVYTNSQLTPEHFHNKFGNMCLSVCNEYEGNQVVLSNADFMTYIRTNYPNLSFVSSTTKCLVKKEDFVEELHDYDFIEVCLDYNLNHNWNLLDSLTEEEKQRCEFLCNAICPPGCPTRKKHYALNSLYNLSFGRNYEVPYCGIKHHSLSPENKNYFNNISFEEIVEKYEPKGFCHFKLEGRTFSQSAQILIYATYMVKPEYKNVFVEYMLN